MRKYLLFREETPPPNPVVSSSLLDGAMKTILAKPGDPNVTPPAVPPPSAPSPTPSSVPLAAPIAPVVTTPLAKPVLDATKLPPGLLPGSAAPATVPDVLSDQVLDAYEKGLPEAERAKFNAHVRVNLKRIPALEKEVLELKARAPSVGNDEAIKAAQERLTLAETTNKNLEQRLAQFDLKATQAYQQKFTIPEQKLAKQIKGVLEAYEVEDPEGVLAAALAKDGAEMVKVLKDKATPATAVLFPLVTELQGLRAQAVEAEKNASVHLQQMTEQGKIQMLEQQRVQRDSLFTAALQNRLNKGDFLLREVPGDEGWNKEIKVIRDMGKAIGESNDPGVQANAHLMAAQFPVLQDLFVQLQGAYTALQKEYQQLTGKVPGIGSNTPPNQPAPAGAYGKTGSEAARDILAQLKMG